MNWKLLPTLDSKTPAASLPPRGRLIAMCDNVGTIGTGYFTGTTFTGALCNAHITHWAPLDELPKPDCYKLPPPETPGAKTK
jgi:hypothetical protein